MVHHVFAWKEYPPILSMGAGLGFILWVIVFVLIILQGRRDKVCGMPILGIVGTLIQCFIYSFIGPWARPGLFVHNQYSSSFNVVWMWRVWFVLQAVVLWQFFRYNRNARSEVDVPMLHKRTAMAIALLILINFAGQWTFVTFYHDEDLNQSDPAMYALLAGSWVLLAFARPACEGLSRTVAWMKAVGTTLIFTCTLSNPGASFGLLTELPRQVDVENQFTMVVRDTPPTPASLVSAKGELANKGFKLVDGSEGTVFREDIGAVNVIGVGLDGKPAWQFVPSAADALLKKHPATAQGLLAAQEDLESIGFQLISDDTIYRPDVGEVDVIPSVGTNGAIWQWMRVPPGQFVVDGEVRLHYEFPFFAVVTGVGLDWFYVYVLTRRMRNLHAQPVPAVAVTA